MGDGENRQITRDSLFVMARLRLKASSDEHRVRVRNLSPGGLMAEGPVAVVPGVALEIEIRNIGWVDGSVAWVQDNRFGIAFSREIDPQVVRAPATTPESPDLILRRPVGARTARTDPGQLRQV